MSSSSYPKGSRATPQRSDRSIKRTFQGNQFVDDQGKKKCENPKSGSVGVDQEEIPVHPNISYRIIEFYTVFLTLADIIVCRTCKGTIKFQETPLRGLGFKIIVECKCGRANLNLGPMISNGYEINRRFVFVMRLLAVSKEGINLFCNLTDISKGFGSETYVSINKLLHESCYTVFKFCCKKAIKEEVANNEKLKKFPSTNLKVSGDGTWKKRDHLSKFGVVTLIANSINKVIDLKVKSTFCKECSVKNKQLEPGSVEYAEWLFWHESVCTANRDGSAGAMEPASIIEMFQESVTKYGVRYAVYIGDGDSSTFKNLLDIKPYGDDLEVSKSECVGHVQKRIGSQLRSLKKKEKLSGKGRLTENLIKELTTYYGLAIKRNSDNVENMKHAIMATYYHKISTDENPQHQYCDASWCWWQAREQDDEENNEDLVHDAPLDPVVAEKILPIYEKLSRDDLLERCLGGYTQNSNGSLNALIWKFAPKHLHSGKETVEMAAYLAACIFNESYLSILWIMDSLKINIGKQSYDYASYVNKQREAQKQKRRSASTHEARKARLEQLYDQENDESDADQFLYGAGIAD